MPPKRNSNRESRLQNFEFQLTETRTVQTGTGEALPLVAKKIEDTRDNTCQERRQNKSFFEAFQTFFSKEPTCTLNESGVDGGDRKLLEANYSEIMTALGHPAQGTEVTKNGNFITHKGQYEFYLVKNFVCEMQLPVGYFLYKTGIDVFHVIISHPHGIERENICLSDENPPVVVKSLLRKLPWEDLSRKEHLKLDSLDKKLELWIISCSVRNTKPIRVNDIFLENNICEKFSQCLSYEAREPQTILGKRYEPLVSENGHWARFVTFFGVGFAHIRHLHTPPRRYGHDTVVNREKGERENEIVPILTHIANKFMEENIEEIHETIKNCS